MLTTQQRKQQQQQIQNRQDVDEGKDELEELATLVSKAESGDASAMYVLGTWYRKGLKGLPKDRVKAIEWFQKSSDLCHPKGMSMYGETLLFGVDNVPQNIALGSYLLGRAVEAGVDQACHWLGRLFHHGNYGYPKDTKLAKFHLRKAVDGSCSHQILTSKQIQVATELLSEIEQEEKEAQESDEKGVFAAKSPSPCGVVSPPAIPAGPSIISSVVNGLENSSQSGNIRKNGSTISSPLIPAGPSIIPSIIEESENTSQLGNVKKNRSTVSSPMIPAGPSIVPSIVDGSENTSQIGNIRKNVSTVSSVSGTSESTSKFGNIKNLFSF